MRIIPPHPYPLPPGERGSIIFPLHRGEGMKGRVVKDTLFRYHVKRMSKVSMFLL